MPDDKEEMTEQTLDQLASLETGGRKPNALERLDAVLFEVANKLHTSTKEGTNGYDLLGWAYRNVSRGLHQWIDGQRDYVIGGERSAREKGGKTAVATTFDDPDAYDYYHGRDQKPTWAKDIPVPTDTSFEALYERMYQDRYWHTGNNYSSSVGAYHENGQRHNARASKSAELFNYIPQADTELLLKKLGILGDQRSIDDFKASSDWADFRQGRRIDNKNYEKELAEREAALEPFKTADGKYSYTYKDKIPPHPQPYQLEPAVFTSPEGSLVGGSAFSHEMNSIGYLPTNIPGVEVTLWEYIPPEHKSYMFTPEERAGTAPKSRYRIGLKFDDEAMKAMLQAPAQLSVFDQKSES